MKPFFTTSIVWIVSPVVAALAVVMLLVLIPVDGRGIIVSWGSAIDSAQRQMLERRLQLVNPSHIKDTTWGYVLRDTSESNVLTLINLPEVEATQFVIPDPPNVRLSGPMIIRLIGPVAVQSILALVIALLMVIGSNAPTIRWRQLYLACACVLLGVCWTSAVLPLKASHEIGVWMGDYDTYTMDREHFRVYFGYETVRLHFHLGGFVLNILDRALGESASSMQMAFVRMSWLAGAAFLAEAIVVAAIAGWSAHVMRYLGISMAAPLMLSFFGYRELGYLSLSIAAFPLLLSGLMANVENTRTKYLAPTGVLLGLRSALHGFGLVGLGGALLASLISRGPLRSRFQAVSTVFVWGFTSYLIWLLGYLIILGLPVVPGHATGIPFRRLVTEYVAEDRMVYPIASSVGLRDLGLESILVGVPILVLGMIAARGLERTIGMAFALPSVIFLLLFWPAQGIAVDMDAVFAAFPAFFAGAWMCARNPRITSLALVVMAVAHAVFWFVIRNAEFTNFRVI